MEKYNERIKALREDQNLTQTQIANILKTTQQQIYKYESGAQEMTVGRLKALCEFYGVSADYVLGLPQGLKWPRPGKRGTYRITNNAD